MAHALETLILREKRTSRKRRQRPTAGSMPPCMCQPLRLVIRPPALRPVTLAGRLVCLLRPAGSILGLPAAPDTTVHPARSFRRGPTTEQEPAMASRAIPGAARSTGRNSPDRAGGRAGLGIRRSRRHPSRRLPSSRRSIRPPQAPPPQSPPSQPPPPQPPPQVPHSQARPQPQGRPEPPTRPQPQPPRPQPQARPQPQPHAGARGFLGALFDFGFTSFVTPRVVEVPLPADHGLHGPDRARVASPARSMRAPGSAS